MAAARSSHHRRYDGIHRAQFAGQGQFANEFMAGQRVQRDLPTGGQDAQGDGKIEAAAILG